MSWTVAESLLQLDREIDAAYPDRSTRSDGFIGDAAHRGRGSAHNPDNDGIVRAGDWTSTDTAGKQIPGFGDTIVAAAIKHPAALLVIHAGHIWSRNHGWRKRKYNGSNPHTNHVHVSILNTVEGRFSKAQLAAAATNTTAWGIATTTAPTPAPAPKPAAKSIAQMAQEVIDGKHGIGHTNRRRSLGVSASVYEQVRAEVNRRVSGRSKPAGKSIAQMAPEVIAGKHGNGHANRRKSLGVDAATYAKVRAEVNRRV